MKKKQSRFISVREIARTVLTVIYTAALLATIFIAGLTLAAVATNIIFRHERDLVCSRTAHIGNFVIADPRPVYICNY